MRLPRLLLLILLLPAFALASDAPTAVVPPRFCVSSATGASACDVTKQDLKAGKAAFSRALKLQHEKRLDEALDEFETAARLVPQDVEFLTARELVRQQLIYNHLERGNSALAGGNQVEALAEFRLALHLDPENQFARQRLNDALGEWAPRASGPPQILVNAGQLRLVPGTGRAEFHFRGDSRDFLTEVATAYGVTAIMDDSVQSRRVRFDIQNVDFYTAMQAANAVTKTFWTPLEEKQILLAADTAENHRQFDRMSARTFYIPGVSSPQDLNDVVNTLRTVFEVRLVAQQPNSGTVTVRAPQRILDAATEFIESLDSSQPEVMLDIKVYEVSRTLTRNLGLQLPTQFQMFNIPAGALTALGGKNIQDLINQLIASGGINQANTTAISALLAQLQSQQNSIFSQPLATFGNGSTLFGVTLGSLGATLSRNEALARNLEHATLRASQGKDTNFRLGTRYPVINASFAPIFNSSAISHVIGNNSFIPAVPSVNYEDIGLTIKAKPQIHGNTDVSLNLALQLRSLGAQSVNGVPIINSREYNGTITLKDGEPGVVTGSLSRSEQFSMSGIPGLSNLPLLNRLDSSNTKQHEEDELLVVITPHVVSLAASGAESEIWLSPAR
jgi:tetratricopeptide (TPR) repeat protein